MYSSSCIGGLATIVASYLARARGSNEPELSITRVKDLEQFIRECDGFIMDHGYLRTNVQDKELLRLRDKFEELLGNASGSVDRLHLYSSSFLTLACSGNESWPRRFSPHFRPS